MEGVFETMAKVQRNEYQRASWPVWKDAHPETYARKKARSVITSRRFRSESPDASKMRKSAWAKSHRNAINRSRREYYRSHAEQERERYRLKAASVRATPHGRLRNNLARRILLALSGKNKSASTEALVGCSISFLRDHIAAQFRPGMTWGNIHIDHIRPCASFDLSDPKQQRECFNYKNLQPLFPCENLRKGARIG